MKRFVAVLVMMGMFFTMAPSFVFAQKGEAVTREMAIAAFVRATEAQVPIETSTLLERFSDWEEVTPENKSALSLAVSEGWVEGYEDHTLRPQGAMTRLEALVILQRVIQSRTLPQGQASGFSDVPDWAADEIQVLERAGIVEGYGNGMLGAEDLLTEEQLLLLSDRCKRILGPQGDFYEYVNTSWLSETQIPQGMSSWSDVNVLTNTRMVELWNLVYDLYQKSLEGEETYEKGTPEQKLVDVFSAGVNMVLRNGIGLDPAQKYMDAIDGIQSMEDLLCVMAALEKEGFHGLFPLSAEADMKNSSRYILTFSECYLGMQVDRVKGDLSGETVKAYTRYLEDLFTLYGYGTEEVEAVVALCTQLAKASLSLEEHQVVEENYRVYDAEEQKKLFRHFPIEAYLLEMGFPKDVPLLIYDQKLAETVDSLFVKDNLSLLKNYLRASVMDGAALYLNEDAFFAWRTYQEALSGVTSDVLPQNYALSHVEELLGWELAYLYEKAYGAATPEEEVEALVKEVLDAYIGRVKKNPKTSKAYKKTAAEKLAGIRVRVGYPENMEDYLSEDLSIISTRDGGNLLVYRAAYCRYHHEKVVAQIQNKLAVDRDRWQLLPYTANALYEPATNSITIPAGLLDAPFYDPAQSREEKLGSMGMVIAHEISHALDAVGARFDAKGNLSNWWTKADKAAFEKLCQEVEGAYNDQPVLPDVYVDGKQTLSENLADLSAMACVLELVGENNPSLEDVFKSYAKTWRSKVSDGYLRFQVESDTHAPEKIRVNRVLANFDAFHDLYHTEPTDGMYLSKEERIAVW